MLSKIPYDEAYDMVYHELEQLNDHLFQQGLPPLSCLPPDHPFALQGINIGPDGLVIDTMSPIAPARGESNTAFFGLKTAPNGSNIMAGTSPAFDARGEGFFETARMSKRISNAKVD